MTTTTPLDWSRDEIRLGELILAAKDMQVAAKLIARIPPERDPRELLLDAVGVIASYCRPFKRNSRDRKVGEAFLPILDESERKLHDKIVDLRDKDFAHTDMYDGRVKLQSDGATVWLRDGAEPGSLRNGRL